MHRLHHLQRGGELRGRVGEDSVEALRTAVNTACGTITQGMDESIRCAGLPPQRPQCRTR